MAKNRTWVVASVTRIKNLSVITFKMKFKHIKMRKKIKLKNGKCWI